MFRKTIVVLAVAFVLGGSTLSSNAFARGGDHGGRSGLGAGDVRSDHSAGTFGGGRTVGNGYGGYDGRVSGLRGGVPGDRRGDVWHHWGAYYGPMIGIP